MADPRNPLAGREGYLVALIADLTDDELRDFQHYWEARHAEFEDRGDGYSAWWCSKHISAGLAEGQRRAQRGLGDGPFQG